MNITRQLSAYRKIILTTFLLVSLVFTCRGFAVSYFSNHNVHTGHAPCCTETGSPALTIMHEQLQSALPVLGIVFVVALFIVLGLNSRPATHLSVSFSYSKWIRNTHGSWRIFIFLVSLLKKGILNPKLH